MGCVHTNGFYAKKTMPNGLYWVKITTNEHYFYKWTDCDDVCNRWLIFSVSIEKLNLFFEQKVNLLQLIKIVTTLPLY